MNNNEELKKLMAEYGINHTRLAELIYSDSNTTRAWTCAPDTKRYRSMPDMPLEFLKLRIVHNRIKPINQTEENK